MKNSTQLHLVPENLVNFEGWPGIHVPRYDRAKLSSSWFHIGCGAFHRAHQAVAADTLLGKASDEHREWAITGVNLLPSDKALTAVLHRQHGLYSVLERDVEGEGLRIVGSVLDVLFAPSAIDHVINRMTDPAVKLVTLTVTESGYYSERGTGRFLVEHPDIQSDLILSNVPKTALGVLTRVLGARVRRGIPLPTVLSCDNVKENGEVLHRALVEFSQLCDPELARRLAEEPVFPNSMVDRITPRTTDRDKAYVRERYGVGDEAPVVSETFWQWVIEDRFALGRPRFELMPGVIFTADVRPYEDMKLRLLNAGHSQCGYLGYLTGFSLIDEVASDPDFARLLDYFWKSEVVPNLPSVPGIDFDTYCQSLIARFSNKNLGDQTLRICLDGSAKIPTFILPSIRDGLRKGTPIDAGCLCVAAWIRFCGGNDEKGEIIPIEDGSAAELRRLGYIVRESGGKDATAFLQGLPVVFGELAAAPAFAERVGEYLNQLYSIGARATLRGVLEQR